VKRLEVKLTDDDLQLVSLRFWMLLKNWCPVRKKLTRWVRCF